MFLRQRERATQRRDLPEPEELCLFLVIARIKIEIEINRQYFVLDMNIAPPFSRAKNSLVNFYLRE